MENAILTPTAAYYHSFDPQQQTCNGDPAVKKNVQGATSTTRCLSDSITEPYACESAGKWIARLLEECARAISEKDSTTTCCLLWMLNELASPYGDRDQRLASYFLQALFYKATETGIRSYKILTSVVETSYSFDSAMKLMLKFQEVSPWTTFGHAASNEAIIEAMGGQSNLHVIDISETLCTQWPTLVEALATRNDETTPHLKLTVVATGSLMRSVVKDIGQRMEKFARLMRLPFEFNVITGITHLADLSKEGLGIQDDESIAVNCIGALQRVVVNEQDAVIQLLHSLRPRIVTVVEEEADFVSTRHDGFVKCFEECLRFYTLFFDMLYESFAMTSNERLMLERECLRSILSVLACRARDVDEKDGEVVHSCEMRQRGSQWCEKLKKEFTPVGFSSDAIDNVKALLRRYQAGWGLVLPEADDGSGIYLTWKDEPAIWSSAWGS